MQVCEAISSRCISLQRNVNGNMDSAKYQSDIIHDIEILCECVCSHLRDTSLYVISRYPITLNSTRTFQQCKGIPDLE